MIDRPEQPFDNNGNYAKIENRDATNGTRGPAFKSIIGRLPGGSKLYTGGYNSYKIGFTLNGHNHGWAGALGNRQTGATGASSTVVAAPRGIETQPYQPVTLFRNASYSNSVFQKVRSGEKVTSNVGESPQAGTRQTAYDFAYNNFLNVNSDIWYKGIDTTEGQGVGGSLQDDKFYG